MHRANRVALGTLGIALVLVAAGAVAGGLLSAGHSAGPAHPAAAAPRATSGDRAGTAAHPLQSGINVTYSSVLAPYQTLPFYLNFSWTATGVTNISGVYVTMVDHTTGLAATVLSFNSTLTPSTTNVSFQANATSLGCSALGWGGTCATIPQDQFGFLATVQGNNSTGVVVGTAQLSAFLVTIPVSAALAAPAAGAGVSTGNVTISVVYNAQYVSAVTGSVFSSINHATVIFSKSFVYLNGAPVFAVWSVGSPGSYPVTITLATPYQTFNFTSQINVTQAGGGTTYFNSTSYHNNTFIPGIQPAVGGTILLVVGLIIGMIVAMVLGRMLWGTTRVAPVQPYSTTTTTTTTNQCSVCGKSFATEDELKDHAKSEHGMG